MISASLLLALTAPAQVHVVDVLGGPGAQHVQIYDAVVAAAPGDTILVREGYYVGFEVAGKGLVITADLGAQVTVNGPVVLRDLPAGQALRVSGLIGQAGTAGEGLEVRDCDGPVWIEDCFFAGPALPAAPDTHGAHVISSPAVSFHRCALEGARALGFPGGAGLRTSDSLVALFDCSALGGLGGATAFGTGLPAGAGAHVSGGTLYTSGSSLEGGPGGTGSSPFGCGDAGDGAPGLLLEGAAPHAQLLDTLTTGGAGGTADPPCSDGVAGPGELVLAGSVLAQSIPARSIEAANPVRPGELLTVAIGGVPGDAVFLWVSGVQSPLFVAPGAGPGFALLGGVFLPDVATSVILAPGTIGPSGLSISFTAPNPPAGVANVHAQALVVSASAPGELVFSSGQAITVLGAGL